VYALPIKKVYHASPLIVEADIKVVKKLYEVS
jgi:hypothetical protein